MRTVRRLIYRDILRSVGFVALAFLLLFFFFDMVDQLGDVRDYSSHGYSTAYALLYVALRLPSRLYDLLPIAVLIGTIFVLARLAETSQYTILRVSGLDPLRALGMLLALGAAFGGCTFLLGDYAVPAANRMADLVQARFMGDITVGRTGAWMKDLQGQSSHAINIGSQSPDGRLNRIRIFSFDRDSGRLQQTVHADWAEIATGHWTLHNARTRDLSQANSEQPHLDTQHDDTLQWPSGISADMVAAALLSPDRMRTPDLLRYARHLQANGQNAQRYEIEFWHKIFYPLGCLVMMVLALPFAYLHFRSRHITAHVFVGILIGISFFLLNNVFSFVGNLRNWTPWVAAATPGLLYTLLSLIAFNRLVRRS